MPPSIILLFFVTFTQNLHAYLDPGTGSLLLSSMVAIFASLIYFLKGFFYKIKMGGNNRKKLFFVKSNKSINVNNAQTITIPQNSIVIYSEDKRYFSLFKPIVDAFELLKYPYTYYTGDKNDPILDFKSEIGHIECIGVDNKAFAKLNTLEADICIMTTPQLDVLQLKRSKGVKHYCHILHSLPHVDIYEIFALDYFDSVFTNSPIHTDFIREVESIRHLKHKQIEIVGCPYLDYLQDRIKSLNLTNISNNNANIPDNNINISNNTNISNNITNPTILVAPSWGREALLSKYGMKLLKPLLDIGYPTIIRPHPQSYISEIEMLKDIQSKTTHYTNLKWDNHIDNIYALAESNLMIGDFSGVLFDYVALFNKPIITMEFNFNIIGYDLEDTTHKIPWVKNALKDISITLNINDFNNIKSIIDSTLKDTLKAQNRIKMKELLWHCQGNGGKRAAIELIKIHKSILEEHLGQTLILHKQILAIDKLLKSNNCKSNLVGDIK